MRAVTKRSTFSWRNQKAELLKSAEAKCVAELVTADINALVLRGKGE